ncbi:MAG: YceI family protein [Xanthomonadales bacterium]|nr:YceI family protein [Xanthomonadales bacterium]
MGNRHWQILAGSVLALALMGTATAADHRVSAEDSTLAFSGKVDGEAFDGQFHRFYGQIRFDADDLAKTHFAIDIETGSVDTDSSERDEALATPEWFNSALFPAARFEAEGARVDGDGYRSDGQLTIRGRPRPVSLHYALSEDGSRLRGSARLNRIDWGLGGDDWADDEMVAHAVEVRVDVQLR